jgi:hypothetical protein
LLRSMPAGGPSKHPFGKQEARNQLGLSVASTQDTVEQFGTNLASQHHLKATHVAMGQCTGLHLEAVRRAQLQPAPGSGAAVGAGKPAPKVWQHSFAQVLRIALARVRHLLPRMQMVGTARRLLPPAAHRLLPGAAGDTRRTCRSNAWRCLGRRICVVGLVCSMCV